MSLHAEYAKPTLVIVAGRPGAGKTTLARMLAQAIRCPVVCRDEIKEGLICTRGAHSEELQRDATNTFFDALALLIQRGITVVAEAAFQHHVWAPRLEQFSQAAHVRIVLCSLPPEIAEERERCRELQDPGRAFFHPRNAQGDCITFDPPRFEHPTLEVDTSDGYRPAFDSITRFACR